MEYVTAIVVAIFGSTLLSTMFNQLINWRSSSRGDLQFTSWNRQIEEIARLDKAAIENSSNVDGIAKGWVIAARAETISSISKRLVPSKWGMDILFAVLGSLALIVGSSMLIALLWEGVPEGPQGEGMIPNSVFFTTMGVLGLFTAASNEMTVSSVRNKISVALYRSLDRNPEFQDATFNEKSIRFQSVGTFERLWLGPAVANTADRLISELRYLNRRKRSEDGASEGKKI